MNRVIKFRAWDKEENKMINNVVPFFNSDGKLECLVFGYSFGGYDFIEVELDKYQHIFTDSEFEKRYVLMQYTGLKDRNGVEIYEHSELDGAYEVIFKDMRYSLRHIRDNDIIDLHDYWRGKNGEIEVTREYTKV